MTFSFNDVALYTGRNQQKNFSLIQDIFPFVEFEKSIGHITVLLHFASIGGTSDWKGLFNNVTRQIDACLDDLPKQLEMLKEIDGLPSVEGIALPLNSSPEEIVDLARKLLTKTQAFLKERLSQGSYSPADYKTFMDNATATDFLDFVYELWYTQQGRCQLVLQKWKKEMAANDWDQLIVVTNDGIPNSNTLGGVARTRSSGQFAAGYTHMKGLMTPENAERYIVSFEDTAFNGVENLIATVKMSVGLGDAMFPTAGAQANSQGMYSSLVNSQAPLDQGFMKRILSHFPPPNSTTLP